MNSIETSIIKCTPDSYDFSVLSNIDKFSLIFIILNISNFSNLGTTNILRIEKRDRFKRKFIIWKVN